MIKANNDQYFPALTGVRAIAAYMVFLHHYLPFTKDQIGVTAFDMVHELHVGVTLFFVLSGFLIAYRYIDIPKFDFRNYIVNRVARIYPMYLLLTTFTFLWLAWRTGANTMHDLAVYIYNITFIRGFFNDFKFSGIAQGWSLTVEETFYFLAPMFFLFIRRMKSAVVLLPVLLIALGSFLVFLFKDSNFNGFFGSMEFMMNYTFFGRCCEFFVGIALALIFKKNDSNRSSSYFTYVGLAMMILCLYFLSQAKGSFELGIRTPMGKMINTFALPVSGIAVFYYGLLTEKTLLSKILSSKIFVLLGKSSYVFYLIHMGVFGWVILKFTNSILLLFVLLNIVSVLFFSYIEEPLNHYLRKKLRRQQILN